MNKSRNAFTHLNLSRNFSEFTSSTKLRGFTIVELLVVIVVIAILAAITIVSYTGITNKAIVSSLQSDLDNASRQLKLYYTDHGSYPTSLDNGTNCPRGTSPDPDTRYCLKTSNGNALYYIPLFNSFRLTATNTSSSISYRITDNTSPTTNYNLLNQITTGDNASFEDETTGDWTWPIGTIANSSSYFYHGLKSLAITSTNPYPDLTRATLVVTGITSPSTQYTLSAWVKGVAGREYQFQAYDDNGGEQNSPTTTGTGNWQRITFTFTYSNGGGRYIYLRGNSHVNGEVDYWDAVQLEVGSTATPF